MIRVGFDALALAVHYEEDAIDRAVSLVVQVLALLQVQLVAVVAVELDQLGLAKRLEDVKLHADVRRLGHLLSETFSKQALIVLLGEAGHRDLV